MTIRNTTHYKVRTEADLKKLAKTDLSKTNMMVLLYSETCGPCHQFLPTWDSLVKSNKMNTLTIEAGMIHKLPKNSSLNNLVQSMIKKSPYVPNVAKHTSQNKVHAFKGERSLEALTKFHLK